MSPNIFFDPWVGENYGKDKSIFKNKLLILGDSHYCDTCPTCGDRNLHPDCADFTNDRIYEYLDESKRVPWKKTFSTFVNSMAGKNTSFQYRDDFFQSVVFYNYLQESAGKDAYSAREYDYGKLSHLLAFYEVMTLTLPDIVISWGNKAWDALPADWGYGKAQKGECLIIGNQTFDSYYHYPYKDKRVLLIGIHHPSQGYDSQFHGQVFQQLGVTEFVAKAEAKLAEAVNAG